MGIDALIFDVDGTLADTEEAHRVAFNLAFERYSLGWSWSRAEYRGLLDVTGGKERIAGYIQSLPLAAADCRRLLDLVPHIHREKTRFYSSMVNDGGIALRDGVARLLDEALHAGRRLAIASTTSAINVDALLHSTLGPRGLEMFSVIACGDQVKHKKPAPDIYQLALRTLGLTPDRAVALEDSANGLRAAVAAGLWTVITPTFWTEGSDFSAAGLVLPRLGDPHKPLNDEPGRQLKSVAWLSFEELARHARPPAPLDAVQALYRRVPQ
ncbi:HAD-IA family hydrolase [Methylibium sp.]|uniref:HAD-IA family hydrolase n=1 Tax=Methylibium sp. TaxID=2067992 RepID=UPI003D102D89